MAKIVKAEVRKDVNHYCVPGVGCIDQYDLVVYTDGLPLSSIELKPVNVTADGTLHYGEDADTGMVRFGYESFTDKPGHGGMWSSNGDTVRRYTGKDTIDVCHIDSSDGYRMAGHILCTVADRLIGNEYAIVRGYDGEGRYIVKYHDYKEIMGRR